MTWQVRDWAGFSVLGSQLTSHSIGSLQMFRPRWGATLWCWTCNCAALKSQSGDTWCQQQHQQSLLEQQQQLPEISLDEAAAAAGGQQAGDGEMQDSQPLPLNQGAVQQQPQQANPAAAATPAAPPLTRDGTPAIVRQVGQNNNHQQQQQPRQGQQPRGAVPAVAANVHQSTTAGTPAPVAGNPQQQQQANRCSKEDLTEDI